MGEPAARKRLREERKKAAAERESVEAAQQQTDKLEPCVCGDPNCMPWWRPVHQHMNDLRIRADQNAAGLTNALIEEICNERTRAEQAEAERDEVRARLAKIGETHVQWGAGCGASCVHFSSTDETEVRDFAAFRDTPYVGSRQLYAGPWREAKDGSES